MTWGVRDLEVRYGRTVALSGITLDLEPGMITSVVGGDGAGKSTLLKTLVGAIQPRSGTVAAPDRDRIGFLTGQSSVYPDLTVDENLDFVSSAYRGISSPEGASRDRRRDLVRRIGLEEARGRLGAQLSGGMRQKLGVAMAMLHSPDLLVLDEPTTGVDPVSRAELARLMAQAAAEGAAVVASTTYLDEASRAHRVLLLDSGSQLLCGTPSEIVASVPGTVWSARSRPAGVIAWRREDGWHCWTDAIQPAGGSARPVVSDLQDAVLVASIRATA